MQVPPGILRAGEWYFARITTYKNLFLLRRGTGFPIARTKTGLAVFTP